MIVVYALACIGALAVLAFVVAVVTWVIFPDDRREDGWEQ